MPVDEGCGPSSARRHRQGIPNTPRTTSYGQSSDRHAPRARPQDARPWYASPVRWPHGPDGPACADRSGGSGNVRPVTLRARHYALVQVRTFRARSGACLDDHPVRRGVVRTTRPPRRSGTGEPPASTHVTDRPRKDRPHDLMINERGDGHPVAARVGRTPDRGTRRDPGQAGYSREVTRDNPRPLRRFPVHRLTSWSTLLKY